MPPKCKLPDHVETDPTKRLEALVGLPDGTVLGRFVGDLEVELPIETKVDRPGSSAGGVPAQLKGGRVIVLVDLEVFGKATKLHWHKQRWCCADLDGPQGSWTEEDERIRAPADEADTSMLAPGHRGRRSPRLHHQ